MSGIEHVNKKLQIKSFSRIHITLIGMNDDGYRINGGVGFSISTPSLNCTFQESANFEIFDDRILKFSELEKSRLVFILSEVKNNYNILKSISCNIIGDVLPHYGLGSNTIIYLSCIEALLIVNDISYDYNLIVALSKRGGTSGIGINTYFDGGFVFDLGIKNNLQHLCPSSIADRKGSLPLLIKKCESPKWPIGVCIPKYISNKSEQEEIDFFKSNCPIDKVYIERILYEVLFGVTSAVIEVDYIAFCESVNAIQISQWKLLERSIYGSELFKLEKAIKSFGADCVGMTSLGPTLFFLGENIERINKNISLEFPETICYVSSFNNHGREICYD